MKIILVLIAGCALILAISFFATTDTANAPIVRPSKPLETENVRVFAPLAGQKITNPLVVRGEARGNWYFEASFPVHLKDANGKEVAVAPAHADGDWMTTNFVPFSVTLNFENVSPGAGTLILEKDNPSGLPQNDAFVSMPISF